LGHLKYVNARLDPKQFCFLMGDPAEPIMIKALYPGELLKEILDEIGMSQKAFAKALRVSPMRKNHQKCH
jgi:hypothetical protein